MLLTHFEYPAEHWLHLCTTNAIESTFATVTAYQDQGAASRSAGLEMALQAAGGSPGSLASGQPPHLVALVRAGTTFVDGIKVEREDQRNAV